MAEIHVLDKHTAELIAAGEVVERPASVVKELLENSIDAGASQITVSIESGGVRLIEISDNGTGIEAKYIPTAFIRHATSKIRTEEDLTSIHTLGFRGEALASIASVARVEVLTRTEADECASLYRIEGGEEQPIEPGARGVGTTIRVCDLFFNTPARMKFLKKDSSEGTFVADIVGHVALSHPEVSFKFIREGKRQYVTPGDGQLRSAAYAVLGREFSRDLVEVDNREGVYRVWGLITQPRSCRASRSMQYFYINGRYVRNRTMMAGMEMAFKGTTMQGKFPGGILLLEMPADLVDVNVHPAKTEVRFARENDIFDLVYHAVKLALSQPGTGERQFVFDSEKENNVSNEHENSGNKEENTVKNNNFTGLSAVISGQAEPGSLLHPEENPFRPAAPAASVTPRTTQPSAPERDILPLPVKAPEKAAPASEHTWTTVAAFEPLPMNAALHSPEPPQKEVSLSRRPSGLHPVSHSWTSRQTSTCRMSPAIIWPRGSLSRMNRSVRRCRRLRMNLSRAQPRSSWALTFRMARSLCGMWARSSEPISSRSGATISASLTSTPPMSASSSRNWPPTTAMSPVSFSWSRWWWSSPPRKRPLCWPTSTCWKAPASR